MPITHTPTPDPHDPGHYSEYKLSTYLAAIDNDSLELWYNIKFPLKPEVDVVIHEPTRGTVIGEVKGYEITSIKSVKPSGEITLSDGKVLDPVDQVSKAEVGLRNRMQSHNTRKLQLPWLVRTVVWPRITRAEWIQRFDSDAIAPLTAGMLFEDDFVDNKTLLEAMEYITEHHLGHHVPHALRKEQPGIQILRDLFVAVQAAEPDTLGIKDRADLRRGQGKNDARIAKYAPGETHTVMLRGYPGSGKTSAMRDIGLAHARAGKSVLYLCFNKVLATKVRQEIEELLIGVEQREILFTVADEWQFYNQIAPGTTRQNIEANLLAPARAANAAGQFDAYDVILIDEAQDLSDTCFELVEMLSGPETSTFFVFGDGQQLYNLEVQTNGLAPRLKALMERATVEQFKRNFRSGETVQLVCAALTDFYPDEGKALVWVEQQLRRHPTPGDLAPTLDFGDYVFQPQIKIIDLQDGARPRRSFIELVDGLVSSARGDDGEIDALIIVGGTGSKGYQWAKAYLTAADIPFVDYVSEGDNRRAPKLPDQVALTTYYQARGMTCQSALVCDVRYVEENYHLPQRPPVSNVLNIALSRARGTTVVYSGETAEGRSGLASLTFIDTLLARLERG